MNTDSITEQGSLLGRLYFLLLSGGGGAPLAEVLRMFRLGVSCLAAEDENGEHAWITQPWRENRLGRTWGRKNEIQPLPL